MKVCWMFWENINLATEATGRSIAVFAGTLKHVEYDHGAHAACYDVVGVAVHHDDGDPATYRGRLVWDLRRPLLWNVFPMLDLSSSPGRQLLNDHLMILNLVIAGGVDNSNISPGLCNVQCYLNSSLPRANSAQWALALAATFSSTPCFFFVVFHQLWQGSLHYRALWFSIFARA